MPQWSDTRLTDLFGIRHPIIQAGMESLMPPGTWMPSHEVGVPNTFISITVLSSGKSIPRNR